MTSELVTRRTLRHRSRQTECLASYRLGTIDDRKLLYKQAMRQASPAQTQKNWPRTIRREIATLRTAWRYYASPASMSSDLLEDDQLTLIRSAVLVDQWVKGYFDSFCRLVDTEQMEFAVFRDSTTPMSSPENETLYALKCDSAVYRMDSALAWQPVSAATLDNPPDGGSMQFDLDLQELLDRLTTLDKSGDTDAALDVLYESVDNLLHDCRFAAVNKLLQDIPVNRMSIDILLGFLTVTLPARYELPSRAEFLSKVALQISSQGEVAEELLKGLS